MKNEFRNYAVHHLGMNGLALDQYAQSATGNYISPTVIEERQLNMTQMDVFSRLMMNRIIFLGTQIDDYAANVIQAQLLFLEQSDPGKDIQIYINSPADRCMPVLAYMTQCNIFKLRFPQFALVWQQAWLQCCLWLERKASVMR